MFSCEQVPSIDWPLSTKRVLTMEYCEGGQVNDPEYMRQHNISSVQVSALYLPLFICSIGVDRLDLNSGAAFSNVLARLVCFQAHTLFIFQRIYAPQMIRGYVSSFENAAPGARRYKFFYIRLEFYRHLYAVFMEGTRLSNSSKSWLPVTILDKVYPV